MKIAIISDIHGNLEAMLAVQKDMAKNKVDRVFCLGDVVGYGPNPLECLRIVIKDMKAEVVIKGNHEECLCDFVLNEEKVKNIMSDPAIAGIKYAKSVLHPSVIDMLEKLPLIHTVEELGLTLVHASCGENHVWKYVEEEKHVEEEFANLKSRICVLGHTHIPFVYGKKSGLFEVLPDNMPFNGDEQFVVNIGSVGQPRDGDCRASYGIFNFESSQTTFTLRRVFYDISKTEAKIKNAGLPTFLSERLFQGI